jgi:hypothetical protein
MRVSHQLRVDGYPRELFDRPEDALAPVRLWLRHEPDCEPELRDVQTGQAIGPGATVESREELANRIGF